VRLEDRLRKSGGHEGMLGNIRAKKVDENRRKRRRLSGIAVQGTGNRRITEEFFKREHHQDGLRKELSA
jgi:hypothetical protein